MKWLEGNLNLNASQKKEGEKKMERLWKFIKDEDGLETPEYAVMGALIIVGLVLAVIGLRDEIINTFNAMETAVSGTTP